ncbi:hypothetical protein [Planktotalea sp.]|uniref:hypothetical protein n=1 Tax=Planktotalea sp. TaxID=2029877 RepID=UPI0025F00738|nr:hypothetical protein [Planktotalea sp.]
MRALKGDEFDPKGLIAEAYNIEGITASECRTIFLDFALNLEGDSATAINILLKRFDREDHPMTLVLRDGLTASDRPRRRGGWRNRERP